MAIRGMVHRATASRMINELRFIRVLPGEYGRPRVTRAGMVAPGPRAGNRPCGHTWSRPPFPRSGIRLIDLFGRRTVACRGVRPSRDDPVVARSAFSSKRAPVTHLRSFIARAGLSVLVIAIVALLMPHSPSSSAKSYSGQAQTPIQHVVIIHKENRSFDNYFGRMPNVNG